VADSTFDEARRCPKCDVLGADESQRPGPHGSRLHVIRCRSPRCKWYNTTYIVQVDRDGTVAKPDSDRQKFFPKIPDRTDAINESMQRLYNQTRSGGETG
jgi:hypothetical protein